MNFIILKKQIIEDLSNSLQHNFDYRWDEILSKKDKSYDIYARSIFLQGLLITNKNCPLNLEKNLI